MPSIGRTCGRPSSSSAPVCRIGAGGRGRRQGGTHISATACATTVRLRIRARNCKLRPDPEAQRQPAARWLTPCSFVLRPTRCSCPRRNRIATRLATLACVPVSSALMHAMAIELVGERLAMRAHVDEHALPAFYPRRMLNSQYS